MKNLALFLVFILFLSNCTKPVEKPLPLVDANATLETRALYTKLAEARGKHVYFGHQDDLAYGYNWANEPGRSDTKEASGNYPAVFGWDIGYLEIDNATHNIDGVSADSMVSWIKYGHELGGIITISWHIKNPLYEGDAWKQNRTVAEILPGAPKHDVLKNRLDNAANFLKRLIDKNGKPIPVIFRPWHEHNGDWFWWSKAGCTPEEYGALWQFTVSYLNNKKDLHNLLFAISPDRSRMRIDSLATDYFYAWPGDAFVDILGFDNYMDVGASWNQTPIDVQQQQFVQSLTILAQLADQKGKLAALTESGNDALRENNWYTTRFLPGLTANEHTRRITYAMVWRNRTQSATQPDHYYVPHATHPQAADFKTFRENPFIKFLGE
jgi:mannan endo-1,4-beta-mannosidase